MVRATPIWPILVTFNVGAFARKLESRGDREIAGEMMAHLRGAFRNVPDPQAVKITSWGSDPFARGSNSSGHDAPYRRFASTRFWCFSHRMGRKPIIRDPLAIYHVTSRCNNKECFSLPLHLVWKLFEKRLSCLADRYSIYLHAFVLMSNHFHLLLSCPLMNQDDFMRDLMTSMSKAIGHHSGRINRVFGARYKWSLAKSAQSASIVFKYVCRNPVRAGLCERVEDYPYSTLGQIMARQCRIPITDRTDHLGRYARLPETELLSWLNRPSSKEQEELVRRGLRRFEFQLSRSNTMRKAAEAVLADYAVDDRHFLSPKVE